MISNANASKDLLEKYAKKTSTIVNQETARMEVLAQTKSMILNANVSKDLLEKYAKKTSTIANQESV